MPENESALFVSNRHESIPKNDVTPMLRAKGRSQLSSGWGEPRREIALLSNDFAHCIPRIRDFCSGGRDWVLLGRGAVARASKCAKNEPPQQWAAIDFCLGGARLRERANVPKRGEDERERDKMVARICKCIANCGNHHPLARCGCTDHIVPQVMRDETRRQRSDRATRRTPLHDSFHLDNFF